MLKLCASTDLPEASSRGIELAYQQSLFLTRRAGQVYAYLNLCPHRQVPLNWQPDEFLDDSKSLLRCARHGALFLIESGECVSGPCEGEALQALSCVEQDGAIWLAQTLTPNPTLAGDE